MLLEPGTQIAYVPDHARDHHDHQDVEYGFVTSVLPDFEPPMAFCRYWLKGFETVLRTRANSEMTPIANLRVVHTRPQSLVEDILKELNKESEEIN